MLALLTNLKERKEERRGEERGVKKKN